MPIEKLRQDTVRNLPYLGQGLKHQCIYWDEEKETFGVRVYPSGRRTYVCSYRINRRKRLAKLGRIDVLTLDQARKKATVYLGKVADREDPQKESDTSKKKPRIEELTEAYIEGYAKTKKKTWKDDKSILDRFVVAKLKGRLAETITSAHLEPIHAQAGIDHPYAANRILKTYRKMVNWARVAGLLPGDYASPIAGITWFPERKRKRFITTVEMPRFLEALELEQNDYARHGIWLLLLTGLRSNELLKAKWIDIDWIFGTLFIGLTKNGDPLLAPLSDAALARLRVIPRIDGNPYVICGKKKGQHLTNLGTALSRILKCAALSNIRIHDLRRTVGSWLAHAGESLHLIGDVLNHRDPKTTAGYAYFQTQQRRQALSGHADKVLTLASPHIRIPAPPSEVSAQTLLAPTAPEPLHLVDPTHFKYRHYFRREALYELVWTAPVSETARRLGVSDVALAKLCRNTNIPMPGRGYWAKVDAGLVIKRIPLPPAPEGLPQLLRIRGTNPPPNQTTQLLSVVAPPTTDTHNTLHQAA